MNQLFFGPARRPVLQYDVLVTEDENPTVDVILVSSGQNESFVLTLERDGVRGRVRIYPDRDAIGADPSPKRRSVTHLMGVTVRPLTEAGDEDGREYTGNLSLNVETTAIGQSTGKLRLRTGATSPKE